jgi:hypothetical protein
MLLLKEFLASISARGEQGNLKVTIPFLVVVILLITMVLPYLVLSLNKHSHV